MKKALVTGATGFVGSHLVELLRERGYSVVSFDISLGQDITNEKVVEKYVKEVDVVFNLAGLLGTHELIEKRVVDAVMVNTIGAINVLNAAKKHRVDVVEIGKPNIWLNTYSITKQTAEDFTRMYVKEYGLRAWMVRWFNIFGPRQHYGSPQKLAPTSIVKALLNEPIPVFGDGMQTADHIYVKDAAVAAVAIYECDEVMGKPIEVGHHHMTVNEFIRAVIKVTNSKSKINYLTMRRGEDEHSVVQADTKILKEVVGFEPRYSFKKGLKETIDYYRQRLPEILDRVLPAEKSSYE